MEAVIYECHGWLSILNSEKLLQKVDKVVKNSGFKVVGYTYHVFSVQSSQEDAITAVWLLAESHLAIHSFPEGGKTYFQLSSCVKIYFDNFLRFLELEFGDSMIELKIKGPYR